MRDPSPNSLRGRVPAGDAAPRPIRVRSFVLLAGTVGPEGLVLRLRRSLLDLPIDSELRLLDVWLRRIGEFLVNWPGAGDQDPDVRVLVGESNPLPAPTTRRDGPLVRIETDASSYRGTAGVLRDLSDGFSDEEYLLVGNASQCPDEGQLLELVAMADPTDGVTLSTGSDGSPSGLLLVRCGALQQVPSVGYVDLKEQALPRIARTFGVRVLVNSRGCTRPIRDSSHYLDAVRSWHCFGRLAGVRSESAYEERWRPAFSIVEPGADVAKGAALYDSVVLAGGVVGRGSKLIRSVVGPGGVVRRDRCVVDQLVAGGGYLRELPAPPREADR